MFEPSRAAIAPLVRVWCAVHGERRGSEFGAQLWTEGDYIGVHRDLMVLGVLPDIDPVSSTVAIASR